MNENDEKCDKFVFLQQIERIDEMHGKTVQMIVNRSKNDELLNWWIVQTPPEAVLYSGKKLANLEPYRFQFRVTGLARILSLQFAASLPAAVQQIRVHDEVVVRLQRQPEIIFADDVGGIAL